jgi:hypothetical protein
VAKGKSSSSAKAQSNSTPKGKTPPSIKNDQPTIAKKKQVDAQPIISNEQIGHVAGDLWHLLDKDGGQSLASIKKAANAPDELILAAIGWLAREDKLDFTTSGRTLKISLRQ